MNLEERLKQALANRDRLAAEVNRLEARRDLAARNLAEVEAEIWSKGIDPDEIDAAVGKLEASFQTALEKFEAELSELDTALTPYRNL